MSRVGAATAISIRQPWVELILEGRKTVEVRSWRTKHRGELFLHAGRAIDSTACQAYRIDPKALPRGALLGVAELVDCFEFDAGTWEKDREKHLNLGPFSVQLFGWILRNPQRIRPISYLGSLGLMKVPVARLVPGVDINVPT